MAYKHKRDPKSHARCKPRSSEIRIHKYKYCAEWLYYYLKKAYFGGQGRRYYVQHCATLGDIGNYQRKVVRVAGRNCATLRDIGRH